MVGLLLAAAVLTGGCVRDAPRRVPAANFLVDAGDSTFWVRSGDGPTRVRRSDLLLARLDGRLEEVYVTDDDRSYYDAIIIGQRIFRRDLITGDSTLLFEDPSIARVAEEYAAAHPDERPLDPDEDASDDPSSSATTETELLGVLGPWLNVERHIDYDLESGRELHRTRRSVIDLRTGRAVSVSELAKAGTTGGVYRTALAAMVAMRDSVRRSRDERARAAAAALGGFTFDSTSFSLEVVDGRPAITFVVPGQGRVAAGYTLPLPPLPFDAAEWWSLARRSLPSVSEDSVDVWRGASYDVVVRYGDDSTGAAISLRDASRREYEVGRFPTPVMGVDRLDDASADTAAMAALARAFDESTGSDETRTVLAPRRAGVLPAAIRAALRR